MSDLSGGNAAPEETPALRPEPKDSKPTAPKSAAAAGDEALRRRMEYDVLEPVGWRVVIRKDDNRRQTKSGIVLPDSKEIPVITGRIVAVSREVENDEDTPIRVYDKVLFDPREAIPVEMEHDNRLYVVSVDHVVAIFRRTKPQAGEAESAG